MSSTMASRYCAISQAFGALYLLGRHPTGCVGGGVKPVTRLLAVVYDKDRTGLAVQTIQQAAPVHRVLDAGSMPLARVAVERSFPSTLARSGAAQISWVGRAEHCLSAANWDRVARPLLVGKRVGAPINDGHGLCAFGVQSSP